MLRLPPFIPCVNPASKRMFALSGLLVVWVIPYFGWLVVKPPRTPL